MKAGLKLPVGVALFAVLALAGLIGIFAFSSAQSAEAQVAETIEYEEGGTEEVATFTAADPEGDSIIRWSLDGDDAPLFSIENGVLRFRESPDFEEDGTDNFHSVTIQATDENFNTGGHMVRVRVLNKDEAGTLKFTALQPESNVNYTVGLTDEDGTPTNHEWRWSKSSSKTGSFTNITGAISSMYLPKDGDVDSYLRVTVGYTDPHGSGKSESMVTGYPVQAVRGQNDDPEFAADQDPTADGDQAAAPRSIPENVPKGYAIGAPIIAEDDNNDILTYTLGSATPGTGDDSRFTVDMATGQIMTADKNLDFEGTGNDASTAGANVYTVYLRATDPSAVPAAPSDATTEVDGTDTVRVTITVTNVDEGPAFPDDAADVIPHPEVITDTEPVTLATYDADDPDIGDSSLTTSYSISGPDAGKFNIGSTNGELIFEANPDYEARADANMDNTYEVTVVAITGSRSGTLDVEVNVTNVEETGSIGLSKLQPRVGVPIKATLTDPDESIRKVTWQWYQGTSDTNSISGATSDTYKPVTGDIGESLYVVASYTDGSGETTANATSTNTVDAAITRPVLVPPPTTPEPVTRTVPENSDAGTDVGDPVTSTSTGTFDYTLGGRDADKFTIEQGDGQIKVGVGTDLDYETRTTYMVKVMAEDPAQNRDEVDVTIMVTDVNEAPDIMLGGVSVSGPGSVMHDENSGREVATYMASATGARWTGLSGADAGDFIISSGGVLSFRSDPNYEMPADSDANNIYMVTVNARYMTWTDSLEVTVMVIDMDDDGMVTVMPTAARVGVELTASLTDEDGGVDGTEWDWWISDTMGGTYVMVPDELTAMYTPVAADEDKYLKARALYDDAEGMDKEAASYPIMVMGAAVTRQQVVNAIRAYLAGAADAPTRTEVVNLIRRYLAQ